MAVADHIAAQGGDVQIITAREALAPEVGPRARMLAETRLTENPKVRILLRHRVRRIGADHLVVDGPAGRTSVPALGPVLVSHGVVPAMTPFASLADAIGERFRVVGEAASGETSARAAIRDARTAAEAFFGDAGRLPGITS